MIFLPMLEKIVKNEVPLIGLYTKSRQNSDFVVDQQKRITLPGPLVTTLLKRQELTKKEDIVLYCAADELETENGKHECMILTDCDEFLESNPIAFYRASLDSGARIVPTKDTTPIFNYAKLIPGSPVAYYGWGKVILVLAAKNVDSEPILANVVNRIKMQEQQKE
jgi:hypothetical protein